MQHGQTTYEVCVDNALHACGSRFAPLFERLQHLWGALAGGADDEDVPEPLLICAVEVCQLLHSSERK